MNLVKNILLQNLTEFLYFTLASDINLLNIRVGVLYQAFNTTIVHTTSLIFNRCLSYLLNFISTIFLQNGSR